MRSLAWNDLQGQRSGTTRCVANQCAVETIGAQHLSAAVESDLVLMGLPERDDGDSCSQLHRVYLFISTNFQSAVDNSIRLIYTVVNHRCNGSD